MLLRGEGRGGKANVLFRNVYLEPIKHNFSTRRATIVWRSIAGAGASAPIATTTATATAAGAARAPVRGGTFFSVAVSVAASVMVVMAVMAVMAVITVVGGP